MPYDPYSGGFGGSDPYGFGSIFSSLGGLLNGFGSLFPQLQQQQFQQNPFLGGAQGLANSLYQPQTYPDYSSFQPSFNSSMPTGFDTSSYLTQPSSDLAGLMQNLYGQANQGIPTGQQSQPFSNAVLPNLPNVQEIYRPPAGSGTTNLNFTQNANPTITANPTNTFSPSYDPSFSPTNTNTNTANGGAGGSGGSGGGGYDPYSNPYSAISQADRGVTLPGYTGGNSLGTQIGQPVLPGAGGLGDTLGGQGTYGGGSPLSLSDLLGSFGGSSNPFSSGGSIPFSSQPSFTGNNPFGSQATFGGGTPFNSSLGFDPTGGSYTLPANPNSFGGYNPLGTGLFGGGGGGGSPNPFSSGPSMYEATGGSMWNTLPYNMGQMPMGQSPFGPSSPFAQAPSYPQQMYQQPQSYQPQYTPQNYGISPQSYMGAPSGYQPPYAQPQSYGQPAYQPPPPNGSIYSYNQWGQPSVNQPAIGNQPGFSVPGPSSAGWATDPQYQYQQPSYAPQMAYQQQQQQQADQQPFFGQQYAQPQGQQQGLVGILNRFGQYQQQAPQTPPPSLPTTPPASRGGHPMYPLPRQQPPQQVETAGQPSANTDSQATNGSPSRRGYGSVNGAPVRQGDQYTPAQQSGERNSGYAATGAQGPTGSWNPPEIANASTPSQGTPYQPPENNTPWSWQTNGTSANMVTNPGPPPQPTTPQNTQGMNSYAGNSWRPPSQPGQSGYGNTLGTSLPQAGSSRPPPTNGPPSVSNGPLGFRPNTKPMNRPPQPPSTTQGNPQASFIGLGSTAPSPIGPQSPQGSGTMPSLIGGGSQGFQGGQGGMYSSTGAPGSFHPWSGGAPPGYSIQNVPGNLYGSMGAGQQTPANTVTHPGGGKQLAPGAGQPVRRAGLAGMMPRPQ